MKKQINFRASTSTAAKIEELVKKTGMSKTELISVAINWVYREEMKNESSFNSPALGVADNPGD